MKFKKILPLLLLIICAILVFFPALKGEYLLNWDDDQQVTNNFDVLNFSWESIKNYFSTFYTNSYQPLASFSLGLEHYLFGYNPFYPHLTNMLLHIFNIIIAYFLLGRILPKQKIASFFILAIFALHPLQAELMGWISTRSTLLNSFFFLLACLSYTTYALDPKKKKKYIWLTFLFFTLSVLSKATGVVLPMALLSFDYLYRRRLTLGLILEKIPFFIGSITIGIVSIISRNVTKSQGGYDGYYTFYEKLSLVSHTVFLYLKKSFIANDLFFFYGYPYKVKSDQIELKFLLSPLWVILIALVFILVYKYLQKEYKRLWIFGGSFFIVNIFIVLNFTPFSLTFFAERYMYIAIIGVYISSIVLIENILRTTPVVKNFFYILMGVFLISLAIKSNQRSNLWNKEIILWTHVEKSKGQISQPYRRLGNIYANKGNYTKAIEIYNNGIRINPFSVDLYYWRGISIMKTGDLEYAKKDFTRVINAKHELIGDAFYQKSLVLVKQNKLDSARIYNDSAVYHNNKTALLNMNKKLQPINKVPEIEKVILKRIDSLRQKGDFNSAIESYSSLILLYPNKLGYYIEKGKLEMNLQEWSNSVETFSKVIELDSKNKLARLSRAYGYFSTKEFRKSIDDYTFYIDHLEAVNGEVYYFRALSYIENNQTVLACVDLKKARGLRYNVPKNLEMTICKKSK